MAIATFYVSASVEDALFGSLDNADIVYYDTTVLRVGVPGGVTLAVLSGQFQWTPDGYLVAGTLTGFTTYMPDGSGKAVEVSGLRIDMETLFNVVETGTDDDLGELFFGKADTFTGSSGADEFVSYGGNDMIAGGAGNDSIDGGSGNDRIDGGSGDDDVIGGTGSNFLDGGAGRDTMTGGSGADTYVVRDSFDSVVETLSSASGGIDLVQSYLSVYTLPANVENGRIMTTTGDKLVGNALGNALTGGTGADTLYGYGGNDTVNGGDGNDLLEGSDGADTMNGGAGKDLFMVFDAHDTVVESSGGGTDTVRAIVSFTMPANVENLELQGGSIDGIGNGSSNTITGTDATNSLAGGGGNDSLYGDGGRDTLSGGDGNDLLDGGNDVDSLTGGAGNDRYVVSSTNDVVVELSGGGIDSIAISPFSYTLPSQVENLTLAGGEFDVDGTGNGSANTINGNSGINRLTGGDGNDSLYGMEGVDTLAGGNGNDQLDGGSSGDSLTGGAGNDSYVVQNSADKLVEATGGGTDSVSASIDYTLAAEIEKLTLTGGAALDGHGNGLNNTIVGNSGANLLRGSTGNDTLTGGAGIDTFRFSSALNGSTNADTVTDFSLADDVLQLENSVFTKLTSTGVLSSSNFRANTSGSASDNNDYILYETDTGKLFYDADGSGTGAKVLVATLSTLPALTSADIFTT